MGFNDAIIIELSQVPCELICALCLELISNPLQTPCNHVFCAECITPSVNLNNLCPIDRSPLPAIRLIPIQFANPILYRIWNKIKLRCPYAVPNSCPWTGCPESFEAHASACAYSKGSLISRESTKHGKSTEAAEDKATIATQNKAISNLQRDLAERLNHISSQRRQIESFKVKVDPTYRYTIHNSKELSKLIFQELQSPPAGIDRNRIYQCIINIARSCNQYSWDDEIVHNLKMLLAIANASSWFTDNQSCLIRQMSVADA
jgi:hypothetical protein